MIDYYSARNHTLMKLLFSMLGELTDLGRASSHLIGTRLRNLYTEKLGFLPDRLNPGDDAMIYFRSTNMSRTIQSLEGVVRGLLPQTQESTSNAFSPTLLVRYVCDIVKRSNEYSN